VTSRGQESRIASYNRTETPAVVHHVSNRLEEAFDTDRIKRASARTLSRPVIRNQVPTATLAAARVESIGKTPASEIT